MNEFKKSNTAEENYILALQKINGGDTASVHKMIYQRANMFGEKRNLLKMQLAVKLREQLADGYEEARGMLYCYYGFTGQPYKAIGLYLPSAEAGDPLAEYNVASVYYNFFNDKDTARKWFERSANHGNALAQEVLDEWERSKYKKVTVGIFWVAPDGKGGYSILKLSKVCGLSEADSLGFINYRYSHFDMWDYVRGKRTDDCYRYPRGRVLFDAERDRHVIYADKCIGFDAIEEVIEIFGIDAYEWREDEHYVCRRCEKK